MGTIRSEWLNGALVGVDGFCRTISLEAAMARKSYGFHDHFAPSKITANNAYPGFTVTAITAGTLVMADVAGGWLCLTGGGADGHGIQMQSDGEMFLPAADKDIWFEASVKVLDADDCDWFLGLASTDTNVFSTDPTDIIAFRGDDGDANVDFQVRKAGTGAQADSATDLTNNAAMRLGFHVNGVTSVTPFINGTALTAVTTNIPIVELALTFGALDGATQANNFLAIDWYRILQLA